MLTVMLFLSVGLLSGAIFSALVLYLNYMYWFQRGLLFRTEVLIAQMALRGDYHAAVQMTDLDELEAVVAHQDLIFSRLSIFAIRDRRAALDKATTTTDFMIYLASRLVDDSAATDANRSLIGERPA